MPLFATAIFKAVSEGYREFQVIAIISDSKELTSPCGVCRQVMAEFCEPDFEVIMLSCDGKYKAVTLEELLPYAFSLTEEQLATAPELSWKNFEFFIVKMHIVKYNHL